MDGRAAAELAKARPTAVHPQLLEGAGGALEDGGGLRICEVPVACQEGGAFPSHRSPKFCVVRERGGGSAIDLAMHLLGVPFVEAVKRLTDTTPSSPDRP